MNSITDTEDRYARTVAGSSWETEFSSTNHLGTPKQRARAMIEKELKHFTNLGHTCMIEEMRGSEERYGTWILRSYGAKARP